jgi:hypothetical protein
VVPARTAGTGVLAGRRSYDVVFDPSRGVMSTFSSRAILANEIVGSPYHRDLDLLRPVGRRPYLVRRID